MSQLINHYEVVITEAGCAPGGGDYGLRLDVVEDISPVLPYLNALLNETVYDHQNCILIWRETDFAYALRPHRIEITQIGKRGDLSELGNLPEKIVARINNVWQRRHEIEPCFTEKARLNVITIFQQLPKTNCKKCGFITCLAFAAALRDGMVDLKACPTLISPGFTVNHQILLDLLQDA